ncbi:S-layer homology domain-containing protein [Fusibacter bizertensis]
MGLKSNNKALSEIRSHEMESKNCRYIKVSYTDSFVREELAIESSEYFSNKTVFGEYEVFKKIILTSLCLILLLFTSSVGLMPSSDIVFAEKNDSFADVIPTHWAIKFIDSLKSSNIVNGYPDGTFKPNTNVRINEFIAMAVKSQGYWLEPISGDWAKPYIDKALELNIITQGQFKDYSANITRQSMAVITMNTIALTEEKPSTEYDQYVANQIRDYDTICGLCAQSVLDAYKTGITTGFSDKTFRPSSYSTRAEATTLISKIIHPELRDTPNYDFKATVGVYYWVKENGDRVFAQTNIYKEGTFQLVEGDFYMPVYKGINVTEMFELGKYLNGVTLEMGNQPFYLFTIGQDGFSVYGHKSKDDYINIFKNYPQYNDQTVMIPTEVELIIGAYAYLYTDYSYMISLDKADYEKYRGFIEKMIGFSFKADASQVIEKINTTMITDNRDLVKFGIGGRNVYINNTSDGIEIKYSVKYQ